MQFSKGLTCWIWIVSTSYTYGDLIPSLQHIFLSTVFHHWDFNKSITEFLQKSQTNHDGIRILYFDRNNDSTLDHPLTLSKENFTAYLQHSECTKILVYGWMSDFKTDWLQEMTRAYHKATPCEVLSVDWTKYASMNYIDAAASIQAVGTVLGHFLNNVSDSFPGFLRSTHLIGHSLGAHIVGYASDVLQFHGKKANRTTGLDAAAPLFEYPVKVPRLLRISRYDAYYVDVYHSCKGFLGVTSLFGDVDVFINGGGPIQKRCILGNPLKIVTCSHDFAARIFARSITHPEKYAAKFCGLRKEWNEADCNDSQKILVGEYMEFKGHNGTYGLST